MTPNVPLIAWSPDVDPTVPGVITEVSNLLPTVRGYAPDGAETNSTYYPFAMPAAAYQEGAECLYFPGGQIFTYIGAGLNLYMLDSGAGAPSNVSRAGPAYTGGLPGWQFSQFGEFALAANGLNPLQEMPAPYSVFSDVASSPNAQTIAVNRNFVLLGGFNPSSNPGFPYEDGWWCSAQEDHTDWTPDIATQCARGRLTATPGGIVRLIAYRNYVLAFKANSFYRGDYVGPTANTWSFPLVSRSIGLAGRNAICEADGLMYWLGCDGFYRYDGANVQRIASAPWQYITDVCGPFFFNSDICARWDRARRLVRFYMSRNDTGASFGLAYHPDSDRWGTFATTAYCAFPVRFEYVQTPWASSADRYFFALATVDRIDNRIKVVGGGTPGASSLTTGDIGDDDQVTGMFRGRLRYLSAPASSSMTHFHRMELDDPLTTGQTVLRSSGKYDVSHAARWHRMKFDQSGMYELVGVSVGPQASGKR